MDDERTPRRSIPRAELTDTEAARLIGGAAQAYDYENRPRDRNWTAVPLDQVIRLVTGALGAMEFDDAAQEPQPAPSLAELSAENKRLRGWLIGIMRGNDAEINAARMQADDWITEKGL